MKILALFLLLSVIVIAQPRRSVWSEFLKDSVQQEIYDSLDAHLLDATEEHGGINEVNMAVLRFAPELVNDELRTKLIVESLKTANFYYGLLQTLNIVEKYHPNEVIRELFHGLLRREGGVAVHFAAMLFYIYGKAETSFDWEKRAFFLKFNTKKLSDRIIIFQELCKKINVDYRKYLKCNQI